MRVKVENWVRNGGKLLIFGGNTCWWRVEKKGDFIKREIVFFKTNLQEEKLTGLSFRFAGYPIHNTYNLKSAIQAGFNEIDFKNSGGMKVLDSSHPIFYKTDLKNNDMFGIESKVLDNEADGIPIEPKTNKIVSEFKQMFPKNIKILASGWATRPKGKFNYFGSIVEFNLGKGKVMNFGSIGWANSIAKNDHIVKTIISNAIKYIQT